MKLKLVSVIRVLYYIVLIELIIGGSGRIFEIGPITLRMVLFGVCVVFSLFYNIKYKGTNTEIINIQIAFLFLLALGTIVGILNDADLGLIFEDLKPLLFFFLFNFFYISINSISDIKKTITIIKYSALFLATSYIILVILLTFNIINFTSFYQLADSGDFMFRTTNMFFYKGFLYLGIGFLFYLVEPNIKNKLISLFFFITLCLTLTRGFIIMSFSVALLYILFINNNKWSKISLSAGMLVTAVYAIPIITQLMGNRDESNNIRFTQIDQVLSKISGISIFTGHGFGIGVPIRPMHMEISYLEIFHKQGILGIVFWIGLLAVMIIRYTKMKNKYNKHLALPFLLSCIFIYLQSLTNPYMNNPIGLTMILISYVIIYKLSHKSGLKI
jgi:uncharacterized membrane protein